MDRTHEPQQTLEVSCRVFLPDQNLLCLPLTKFLLGIYFRYLWPLIHYHKFLAKCIKKLKRNGVDVKTSVSPVSVFLREDVCAVSDHLAAVSLFDSERWMECLGHFKGWMDTSPEAEARLRGLVGKLKLRALSEPGDVDSPLLRSQIDEHYLRAMADARAQLTCTGSESTDRRSNKDSSIQRSIRQQSPDARAKKNGGPPPLASVCAYHFSYIDLYFIYGDISHQAISFLSGPAASLPKIEGGFAFVSCSSAKYERFLLTQPSPSFLRVSSPAAALVWCCMASTWPLWALWRR